MKPPGEFANLQEAKAKAEMEQQTDIIYALCRAVDQYRGQGIAYNTYVVVEDLVDEVKAIFQLSRSGDCQGCKQLRESLEQFGRHLDRSNNDGACMKVLMEQAKNVEYECDCGLDAAKSEKGGGDEVSRM